VTASELTQPIQSIRAARAGGVRARTIAALGPLATLAGLVWAVVQPYRLTLLHPHGQGFWWLVSEPPLFVILAGVLFHLLVVPGLLRDLEAVAREREERG
jgi:hypothetical protein